MKKVYFCSADAGQTGLKRYIGVETDIFFCTNGYPTEDFNGRVRKRN